MKEIIVFAVLLVAIFSIVFVLFSMGQTRLEKDCNGQVIGHEQSGRERNIWKCADGSIQIF